MSTPDLTTSTASPTGPSSEWRSLYEVWKDRSFELAAPVEQLSPDNRSQISRAGALSHAIVMRDIRADVAPEAAALLDVARGWAPPATSLQRAWLEYQDLCLSHARRVHADAEEQLRTAEARLLAATERARVHVPDEVLTELVRKFDDANAAAASAERDLPQVISTLEAERKLSLTNVDEALNVARASLERLGSELADATAALNDARHRYKGAHEKLICRPARKLGAAISSEVEHLLEQRRTAESETMNLERVAADLKARIDQERERGEHLQVSRNAEERRFNDRVSQTRAEARHLRQQADHVHQQIAAHHDRAAHLLALEVQKEAHAVTVAQNRIAELSPRLMPLGEVAGPHPRKRESFAYLHLCSNRPLSVHHSSFPSILDGCESRGAGQWTLRGQPCHKDALQMAFPEAVQGATEPTEKQYVTR